MKHAVRISLVSLLICLPGMALAAEETPTPMDDRVAGIETLDESQAGTHTVAGEKPDAAQSDDQCSETLDSLFGKDGATYAGICHRLNPPRYCVDYDGAQGGLCPPTCIAPSGGCGYCEQDAGTQTCHCSY